MDRWHDRRASSDAAVGCSTQAELAKKMKLSRSQVNEYVKQFTERFGFVCGATYSDRQRDSRRMRDIGEAGPSGEKPIR